MQFKSFDAQFNSFDIAVEPEESYRLPEPSQDQPDPILPEDSYQAPQPSQPQPEPTLPEESFRYQTVNAQVDRSLVASSDLGDLSSDLGAPSISHLGKAAYVTQTEVVPVYDQSPPWQGVSDALQSGSWAVLVFIGILAWQTKKPFTEFGQRLLQSLETIPVMGKSIEQLSATMVKLAEHTDVTSQSVTRLSEMFDSHLEQHKDSDKH